MNNFSAFPLHISSYKDDDGMYFSSVIKGSLFFYDILKGELQFLAYSPFPEKLNYLGGVCLKKGDYIYCFPQNDYAIWRYSISNRKWNMFKTHSLITGKMVLNSSWFYEDCLYVISNNLDKIFKFNFKTNTDYIIEFPHDKLKNKTTFIATQVYNKIYIVSHFSNIIYYWDLSSGKINEKKITNNKTGFSTICYGHNSICLNGFDDAIYIWNIHQDTIESIKYPSKFSYDFIETNDVNGKFPAFFYSAYLNDYVYFFPGCATSVLGVNLINGKMTVLDIPDKNEQINRSFPSFGQYALEYIRDNRYFAIYSHKKQQIFEYDTQKMKWNSIDYQIPTKYFNILKNTILSESDSFHKELWEKSYTINSKVNNISSTIGKKIYEKIMSDNN